MARERKAKGGGGGLPAWLITFSDIMTLLLTFFVLLNSMAVLDERRKLVVLGSIIGTFGEGTRSFDVLSTRDTRRSIEPGPMEDIGDLEPLKPMLWEDLSKDLSFAENRFVQIFSISSDVLFAPGSVTLTQQGADILARVAPVLMDAGFPILVGGHTSTLREELGERFSVQEERRVLDPSWNISLGRAMAVYRHLIGLGLPPDKLLLEAFGRYHPRHDNATPQGRRLNRRVDIVLDKRNQLEPRIERVLPAARRTRDDYEVGGFVFEVGRPTAPNATENR
ncbi:OmpA/MotB domain protein [Alkalidesulfovibrio alkalitolerans DSM 16529]|jgi:chemotaxis protein MotB|uniref:OmpA/MotB domain protein n=1 Tax=Alkalidesulfovibrio alkalitolerans DSM 16529 TaxID=1121439 RepID=S7UQB3_9BACT|nr:flagellar motor protein MotB [Alkalidesulfovibrio alkalitolerans]EPR34508.1 OmpA/MotB domain protein [Alkalidesulfovibrio alkalitolerans DSM 16529]